MTAHVFTYGSLMFPAVWERVVRGHYRSAPATMHGYRRFAVAGETYPGMVPFSSSAVAGVLYFDVNASDLAALDAFEGDDYERRTGPATPGSGETVEVHTYIYRDPQRLLAADWRPETFQLQRFIDTYCRRKLTE